MFYIIASWLILQLADIMLALMGAPGWIFRFAFALLLICFPLALLFAWIFEVTPDGIKRGQEVDLQTSITHLTGKKINRVTLILLVTAILVLLMGSLFTGPIPDEVPQHIIAHEHDAPSKTVLTGFDLQGHRGARGLMPENTIPAFLHALEIGVTTLELDVAINADGHVVVSHEPWMSARICTHPDGRDISEEEERSLNIYTMDDEQVSAYDCGSLGHPDYGSQRAMRVSKPLLSDVFQAVAFHESESGQDPVFYNIEIKSRPEGDGIFHPGVKEFANILYQEVSGHGVLERTTIQSFDTRALEAVHEIDMDVATALLVDNDEGLQSNLNRLSFTPDIYSPYFELLDEAQISSAHAQNIRVIPWTVNHADTMQKLLDWDVDGLITDYPDLAVEVLTVTQQDQ